MDYTTLEKKKILYTCNSGSKSFDALVAGCEYDIGIAIVRKDNHDFYLVCLNGASSPVWNERIKFNKEEYDEKFQKTVKQIQAGNVDEECLTLTTDTYDGGSPSAAICPFNQ
jgi:hypothetical protein